MSCSFGPSSGTKPQKNQISRDKPCMMERTTFRATTMTAKRAPQKKADAKKKAAADETSASIAKQTAEFLESGGKIEIIQNGVSGQESVAGRKHISYAKS